MSKPSAIRATAAVAIGVRLEDLHHQRRAAQRDAASASATGARVGSRDGMPTANSASSGLRVAGDRDGGQPGAARAKSSWKPGF